MSLLQFDDRRRRNRIEGDFPVVLRATRSGQERLTISTKLINISVSGLFVCLPFDLKLGAPLFVLVTLPSQASMAASGQVIRIENLQEGNNGIAMHFRNTRLMPWWIR